MRVNEPSPPAPDDAATKPPSIGLLRALWRRLTARPRLRPLSTEALQGTAGEWRAATRTIAQIEATTPPLGGITPYLDKLCTALEDDVARLRTPLPQAPVKRTSPKKVAANLRHAQQQITDAEEMLTAMAERSREAGENAAVWERLAMLAVKGDSDALAREALDRRAEMVTVHRRLRHEVTTGRAVLAEMRLVLDQIASRGDDTAKR